MKDQYLSEIKTAGELNKRSQHQTQLTSLYIIQGQEDLMSTFEVDDKVDFYQ